MLCEVGHAASGTAIAVDCAWDVDGVFELAAARGWRVTHALYTHAHLDHCGGSTKKWASMLPPELRAATVPRTRCRK